MKTVRQMKTAVAVPPSLATAGIPLWSVVDQCLKTALKVAVDCSCRTPIDAFCCPSLSMKVCASILTLLILLNCVSKKMTSF